MVATLSNTSSLLQQRLEVFYNSIKRGQAPPPLKDLVKNLPPKHEEQLAHKILVHHEVYGNESWIYEGALFFYKRYALRDKVLSIHFARIALDLCNRFHDVRNLLLLSLSLANFYYHLGEEEISKRLLIKVDKQTEEEQKDPHPSLIILFCYLHLFLAYLHLKQQAYEEASQALKWVAQCLELSDLDDFRINRSYQLLSLLLQAKKEGALPREVLAYCKNPQFVHPIYNHSWWLNLYLELWFFLQDWKQFYHTLSSLPNNKPFFHVIIPWVNRFFDVEDREANPYKEKILFWFLQRGRYFRYWFECLPFQTLISKMMYWYYSFIFRRDEKALKWLQRYIRFSKSLDMHQLQQKATIYEALDKQWNTYKYNLIKVFSGEKLLRIHEQITNLTLHIRRIHRRRSEQLLQVSRLQKSLLPPSPLRLDFLHCEFVVTQAAEVGGDLVDYFVHPYEKKVTVLLIDVIGEGLRAAIYTSIVKSHFQDLMRCGANAQEVIETLSKQVELVGFSGGYVCFHLLEITPGVLTVHPGGIPPLIICYPQPGFCTSLQIKGLPLGLNFPAEREVRTLQLPKGTKIVCFSDGLFEVDNPKGQMLGYGRVKRILQDHAYNHTPKEIIALLQKKVEQWTQGRPLRDDVTIFVAELR